MGLVEKPFLAKKAKRETNPSRIEAKRPGTCKEDFNKIAAKKNQKLERSSPSFRHEGGEKSELAVK